MFLSDKAKIRIKGKIKKSKKKEKSKSKEKNPQKVIKTVRVYYIVQGNGISRRL